MSAKFLERIFAFEILSSTYFSLALAHILIDVEKILLHVILKF